MHLTDMRIGIDASNLRIGGGITHLMELLRAAEPEKHGVSRVVVWGGKEILNKINDRPWLERVYEPALDRALLWRLFWQSFRLPDLAKEHCDILFVPGGSCPRSVRPFVTMSRNLLPFDTVERRRFGASWILLKMFLVRHMQTKSFRKADGVIFLNEYARATILNSIGVLKGRLSTIPHGVNPRFFQAPKTQRGLSEYSFARPFRLLYISSIYVYKHQWHVIDAIARLRRKGIPVELELGGPGHGPSLRRMRKAMGRFDPNGEFVHYQGSIPFSKLHHHYNAADAFVFASSCENMPNILLEAMAAGLPIACSNRGPMPEMLGDAGLYFDPENPGEIEGVLLQLLEQPEMRSKMAREAYERVKIYSWERCAEETFSFITDILRPEKNRELAGKLQ